jgi:hypothetical protein
LLLLQISNAAGYLCHIQLECKFEVPPEVIFEIFCHPGQHPGSSSAAAFTQQHTALTTELLRIAAAALSCSHDSRLAKL